MSLNISIPHFYAKMRIEHLYQHDGRPGFQDVIVFGAQSVAGRALTFHIMTDEGAVRSRVPIHMLAWKEDAPKKPLDHLQLWDCFGYEVTVTPYDYLLQSRVSAIFKDGSKEWGNYLMTFDWYSNPYSEEPTQYKAAHLIKLDDGNFTLQPNNRLMWRDMSFVTRPFPQKPDWKIDNKDWFCEGVSDKWLMNKEDEEIYYYNIHEEE
jgi:hypothetical protein